MHRLHCALKIYFTACFKGQTSAAGLLHLTPETCLLHLQGALMWMMLLVCALWHMEG